MTSSLGALPYDGGVRFRVWAPKAATVTLVLDDGEAIPMDDAGDHTFTCDVPGLKPGTCYRYRLDHAHLFPDPAARYQPEGVHGPSMIVDPGAYTWHDGDWQGLPQRDLVFYELHVGTFTPAGTFDGVRDRLAYLRDLGVTAIELMPVADFPGRWNWGYDHAALYAPSRAYGTPDDLRALVDAAHQTGLAVFLDVIYNHLGPDGAYVAAYAPLFTDKHETPWGQAINLDDAHSEGVRRFFIDNALHWLREYHLDGLRLDATHALVDDSPRHFLAELAEAVAGVEGPRRYLIAEDHRNLNTLLRPREEGGYGLDGVWADDFHHLIRHQTAGDAESYYADFAGTTMADVARTLERGWFYEGQVTRRKGVPRGTPAYGIRHEQSVICIQNHDQVGNRPHGNRLHTDLSQPLYRAASALLLFAPELPLLFMGQEWAAGTPFLFFTDHNAELGPLVTEGRKKEFQHFSGFRGEVPDPQDPATFTRSKLNWAELDDPRHAAVQQLYRDLLHLRRELKGPLQTRPIGRRGLHVQRGDHLLVVSFEAGLTLPLPEGAALLWHTEAPAYTSDGAPPQLRDDEVRFSRPGALVARLRT